MAALTLVACSDDGEVARDLCREHLAYYIGGMGTFYHELMHEYGYGDMANRIQESWRDGNRVAAADAISRDVLDDLAVAGTREDCLTAIEARRAAGISHLVVFPPHNISPELFATTIEAIT